ncbi:MAG: hypothetical protein GX868_07265 [Actinobacteria bacterium]|nr:hypothetical protein [Actinomycetota bacterium]
MSSESPTPNGAADPNGAVDPIAARRAKIADWCAKGTRYGYLAVLAAMVVFVIGFFIGFSEVIVVLVVGLLIVSGALLIPAMIFGYGVKAAEQEERGEKFTY